MPALPGFSWEGPIPVSNGFTVLLPLLLTLLTTVLLPVATLLLYRLLVVLQLLQPAVWAGSDDAFPAVAAVAVWMCVDNCARSSGVNGWAG